MAKKVAVITWDAEMVKFYAKQITSLFGDAVEVSTYNVQDGSAERIRQADLYLVSTCAYGEYESAKDYLPLGGDIVITRVTIRKEHLHKLLAVKRGTRAMVVNISPRMATETMALLNQIGVNNIEFEPYYPGMEQIPDVSLAVTPGETRYIPPQIKQVIDLGSRVLSVDTLIETAVKLRCDHLLEQPAFRAYVAEVVDNTFSFQHLFHRSIQLESQFELLQGIVDLGVIGVDAEGVIFTFNHKAEYVTGVRREDALGRLASELLPDIPFAECCAHSRPIRERLVKIADADVNLTVTPVIRRGNPVGAFATVQKFTDEENKQHKLRMQLMNRGHTNKYTFADIIGESPAIRRACDVARKMAASGASVLITGESGTGKELFAHAIHDASERRSYPFVAINCAAIPDALLESELFGYEEGAFTGAKKGGKLGYFEFAHKGTLFLDEIEGMSQLLQMKLLRVIQEKQVLRVGGSRVINVDVRIIAATNENLVEMVKRGDFRKDLYYRLGVLPIDLPPLREREGDVLLLIERIERQVGAQFRLLPQTREILLAHRWDGNIRELRNCVEYLAYIDKPEITPDDLPPNIRTGVFAHAAPPPTALTEQEEQARAALLQAAGGEEELYRFVLTHLSEAARTGARTGRKALAQAAGAAGFFLSEQEARTLLARLEALGLVHIHRGRAGSRISRLGERVRDTL